MSLIDSHRCADLVRRVAGVRLSEQNFLADGTIHPSVTEGRQTL